MQQCIFLLYSLVYISNALSSFFYNLNQRRDYQFYDFEFMNYNFFVDIDECQLNNPCANDGVCTNTEGTFNCLCTEGWTGRNCTEGKVSNTCI